MSNLMSNIDSKTWRAARLALEKAIALYLNDPNVSHIDLGLRVRTSRGNQIEPELVVRVHVHQKLTGAEFEEFAAQNPDRVIDAKMIGFPVDVIQASYNLQRAKVMAETAEDQYGVTTIIDQSNQIFATVGGKVRDCNNGEEMILNTWHLLSMMTNSDSELYLQQTGQEENLIGKKILVQYCRNALSNRLDAAVAKFDETKFAINHQHGIVSVVGSAIPKLGQKIIKYGAGSGITRGIVTGILGYSIHRFDGEDYVIGPSIHVNSESEEQQLCDFGDSGAWWVEQDSNRAVGLHFAGDEGSQSALALSMPEVLQALEVEIIPWLSVDICTSTNSCHLPEIKLLPKLMHSIITAMTGLTNWIVESWMKARLTIGQLTPKLKVFHKKNLDSKLVRCFFYKQIKSILNNKIIRFYCKLAQVSLIVLLSLMILQFRYYRPKIDKQQQRQYNDLRKDLILIQTISGIEWERSSQIKKIINIIDSYNQDMDYDLKLKIASEIYQMTKKYCNLEIELICATITHETALTWDPKIISPADAIGLMQIIPKTGRLLAKEEQIEYNNIDTVLVNPIINIRLGCRYLSKLISAYNIDGGLAAYNGGMRRAEMWVRNGRAKGILHEETDKYVPSILKIYQEFRRM